MESVSHIILSSQTALQKKMSMTANNIANMTSVGFKAQDILLKEEVLNPGVETQYSMVSEQGSFRRMEQGSFTSTGNPLDVAIQGDGFFAINTPNGVKYTRAGNFALNGDRELVTQAGYPVSVGGGTVAIPDGDTSITFTKNGSLVSESGELGRLDLFQFDNEQNIVEEGDGFYEANGELPIASENTEIVQGMLEASNVQPIVEMNRMIEILRTYQSIQNISKNQHDVQRNMISKLTAKS